MQRSKVEEMPFGYFFTTPFLCIYDGARQVFLQKGNEAMIIQKGQRRRNEEAMQLEEAPESRRRGCRRCFSLGIR